MPDIFSFVNIHGKYNDIVFIFYSMCISLQHVFIEYESKVSKNDAIHYQQVTSLCFLINHITFLLSAHIKLVVW